MKAWLSDHKFLLFAGGIIVFGFLYYIYFYQAQIPSSQQITGIEKNEETKSDQQEETNQNQNDNSKQPAQTTVIVDVKGEIKHPGVYQSNQTERVMDVIQRAGGVTDQADQSQVNFAAHVEDAMVIYIPAKGEANGSLPITGSNQNAAVSSTVKSDKININKADENELQDLPGIGPAKAASIIQYRTENGPFQTIEDLKKISGIGDKTFEKLQESISVQ